MKRRDLSIVAKSPGIRLQEWLHRSARNELRKSEYMYVVTYRAFLKTFLVSWVIFRLHAHLSGGWVWGLVREKCTSDRIWTNERHPLHNHVKRALERLHMTLEPTSDRNRLNRAAERDITVANNNKPAWLPVDIYTDGGTTRDADGSPSSAWGVAI